MDALRTLVRRYWLWLFPLAALILVLVTSYSALTHQRYEWANGTPGDILPGHSVGQTFVARYPNLSAVELWIGTNRTTPGPARSSLVLHLREAPSGGRQGTIQSPKPQDLATATLPAGTPLDENPWYRFSFAAQADSQDKSYYIVVEAPDATPGEALTLFWWQPDALGMGDPYRDGAAYRDGNPQAGDFSLGLLYSPSPLDAWAQMLRAASANFPVPLMLLIVAFVITTAVWVAIRVSIQNPKSKIQNPRKKNSWLVRWSLPTVLAVALLNGVIYIFAVPPWQGPDEHAHFGYAALLDIYDFDTDQVRRLQPDDYEKIGYSVDYSMDRADFTRRVSWDSTPGAPANGGEALLWEADQPPAYYWLGAAALRAVRAIGINLDIIQDPDGVLCVVRFVSLALSLGVVALAWVAGVLLSPRGRRGWLQLLLPLTVALLPMHAFIASTANNDIFAELVVSALFVALVALLKRPTGIAGVMLAALSVALTVASSYTKSSALAASVPLLILGLIVWLGLLITRGMQRWKARNPHLNAYVVPVVMAALVVLAALMLPALAVTPGGTAVGWNSAYWPTERAIRVRTESAHSGSYVLELGRQGETQLVAGQVLVPPVYHPPLNVTFSGWARLAPGSNKSTPATNAAILVTEGSAMVQTATIALSVVGEWTHISGTAQISEGAQQVALRIRAGEGGGPLQFDDLSATIEGAAAPWNDPIFAGKSLLNGSMEQEAATVSPLFSRVLPFEAQQILDAVANPQPFDKGALWSYYGGEEYRSFWGNFGWVSIPLPGMFYISLGALVFVALFGLLWLGIRRIERWTSLEWMGLLSLTVVVVATLLGFARQMTLLADLGIAAYPQGRYLFVLIIPIVWLLLAGLASAASLVWRIGRRFIYTSLSRRVPGPEASVNRSIRGENARWRLSGVWVYITLLCFFGAYCLFSLIMPYYYG